MINMEFEQELRNRNPISTLRFDDILCLKMSLGLGSTQNNQMSIHRGSFLLEQAYILLT